MATRRDSKGRFAKSRGTKKRGRRKTARKSRPSSSKRTKTIRVPKGTKVRIVRTGGKSRRKSRRARR